MSNSVRPYRRPPTRLPRPWDFPGKNTGVGCHFLLQCMKVKVKGKSLSHVQLLATPWTTAFQAPPSMGFSRQEYWSGCHCLLRFFTLQPINEVREIVRCISFVSHSLGIIALCCLTFSVLKITVSYICPLFLVVVLVVSVNMVPVTPS